MANATGTGNWRQADGGDPPFAALAEAHRQAARGWRTTAIALLVVGVLLAVAGLATARLGPGASAVGLVVIAAAAIPWKKAIEHRERAEGVEVLGEEWGDAAGLPQRRARLLGLVRHLYA